MRISDWSSDVCSSDLNRPAFCRNCFEKRTQGAGAGTRPGKARDPQLESRIATRLDCQRRESGRASTRCGISSLRSEEHTSELQSLMRISYAVFCLKKKNSKKKTQHNAMTTHKHIAIHNNT